MDRRLFTTSLALTLLGIGTHSVLAATSKTAEGNFFSDQSIYDATGCRSTEAKYADEACLLPSENALKNKLKDWKDRLEKEDHNIYEAKGEKVKFWNKRSKEIQELAKSQKSGQDFLGMVEKTNTVINELVQYRDDYNVYGKDHWATIVEALNRGGDCEDMALIKAVALRHKGFPLEKMALLVGYVQFRGRRVAHAVLIVEVGNERYVMDNLSKQIVKAREYSFQPLYALNWSRTVIFRNKKK